MVNAPVASGLDLVKPEPLAMKAARAVAECWWRYPAASRYLSGPAQTILGKAIATHYLPYVVCFIVKPSDMLHRNQLTFLCRRAQFLLEHFAFGSSEHLAFMLRDPRVVQWWFEHGSKCTKDNDVHIPSWATLVAAQFGMPYAELCTYLASVVNDFGTIFLE